MRSLVRVNDRERRGVAEAKRILKKIGSKNGVRLMFLLGYLLAFGIPFAYAYLAKPPAESDMRVSEGRRIFSTASSEVTCLWWMGMTTPAEGNI